MTLEKNYLKLKAQIDNLCLPDTDTKLFTVSTNTPLKSFDISVKGGDPSIDTFESQMPILSLGITTDHAGHIWVHNSNNNKLTKYNRRNLTPIVEFESGNDLDISKN